MITAQSYDKRKGWRRLYDWDFSPFDEFSLSPAETGIGSPTVTVSGGDSALVIGAPAISGFKVQILISGGTPGINTTITVSIATIPNSYLLNLDGIINVLS